MKPSRTKIALFSLALVFAFGILLPKDSYSAQGKKAKRAVIKEEKNLEDVKKRLRERTERLEGLSAKESSILSELAVINKRINAVRLDLARLGKDLKKTEADISVATKELKRLTEERELLKVRLNKRLRAIYMFRSGAAVKVLFSSLNSEDVGRRHKYMSLIMDADLELIEKVRENYDALTSETERLEVLREKKAKRYAAYKSKETEAKRARSKRSRFLRQTRRAKSRQARLVGELEGAAKELTGIIAELRDDTPGTIKLRGFALEKGKLEMPVDGRVVSSYGRKKHPRYNTITFNNGIKIKAGFGNSVKSVYPGRVSYVGWLKGYGQVMIIGHGDGFYTLFGHLFRVLKERGSEVKEGEVVALVGDSGTDGVAGLYFEVREGGVPRDPMTWLVRR
jgi:septal ring factor EnvC (AmiA/AmiB activator)